MSTWLFLCLLVVVNSAIWVYFDASRLRDSRHTGVGPMQVPPQTWAAMVFLLWPFAFPYYLVKRPLTEDLDPRSGPPPKFVTEGLNSMATIVGLLGFGIFAGLLTLGELQTSIVGLVVAAVGIFGGRNTHMTRETERVELGSLAIEQVGFSAPIIEDQDEDDGPVPENLEQYFAGMGSPTAPQPGGPSQARAQPAGSPAAGSPAAGSPPAGSPAAGSPPAGSPAAEPPPGVPYSPNLPVPPPGVPYDPSSAGQPAPQQPAPQQPVPQQPVPQQPVPQQPAPQQPAPQQPAPQPATPDAQGPAPGVPYSPPAPGTPYIPPPAQAGPPPAQAGPGAPQPTVVAHAPGVAERRVQAPQPRAPQPPAPQPPAPQPRAPQPRAPQPPTPQPNAPRPSAPRPPAPARGPQPIGSYAHAAKTSPTTVVVRVVAGILTVAVLAALGFLGWRYFSAETTRSAETAAPTEDAAVTSTGDAPGSANAPTVSAEMVPDVAPPPSEPEEGPTAESMASWIESYAQQMGPLALHLDEIDFEGIEASRCRALQGSLRSAEKNLPECPDSEIRAFIEPAMTLLHNAAHACRDRDETLWSSSLVEVKRLTHRAQVILDERYRYSGIPELELEGAIGVQRSTESISGRWLQEREEAGADPSKLGGGSRDDGFEDDTFEEDTFEEDLFEDEGFEEESSGDEGFEDE